MPSLNQAEFIEQAIESVLNQPYKKLELIIADGQSTDKTLHILKRIQSQDSRLKWFSSKDSGPANAINKALSQTKGSIIGWLNSDDLYTSDAVTRAVNALIPSEYVIVYGHGEHIDIHGHKIDTYPTLPPSLSLKEFSHGCFICQPTVFFKQTVFFLSGKLDESLKTAFDFEYWLRTFGLFSGRINFINHVQAQSRLHEDCITHKMRRTVALEGMQIISKYLGTAPNHWVKTYINELLDQPQNTWPFNDLHQHIELMISDTSAYMTTSEIKQLQKYIATDLRLKTHSEQ